MKDIIPKNGAGFQRNSRMEAAATVANARGPAQFPVVGRPEPALVVHGLDVTRPLAAVKVAQSAGRPHREVFALVVVVVRFHLFGGILCGTRCHPVPQRLPFLGVFKGN